jgi:cyclopropane fatty-acyl-phospholipid synthase-like methyltransferase
MDYKITYQIWPHNFQEVNKQARGMRLHQISKEWVNH